MMGDAGDRGQAVSKYFLYIYLFYITSLRNCIDIVTFDNWRYFPTLLTFRT